MKKIFKKNQVVITALAIMIAVAGYLNFTSDKPVLNTAMEEVESEGASGNVDDETVSAAVEDDVDGMDFAMEDVGIDDPAAMEVDEEATIENGKEQADETKETVDDNSDVAQASLNEDGEPIDSDKVGETVLTSGAISLSQAKLNREQTRSKAKDMLLEIINNENLTEDAKKDAIDQMLSMTKRMEKENAAETQLVAKGFENSIVSIADGSVDVTVSIDKLTDQQRTQIEDIIMRKTGCELNEIVISTTK